MKISTQITLLGAALSIAIHLYLAFHYYPVKYGFSSGPSICSINATFDCDAVASSAYSSVFGIPLALWGLAMNLVIFTLVLAQWWQWTDHPERLRRWALILIGASAFASITMGAISTQLHNYCLFCIAAYLLSFLMLYCYRRTLQEPFFAGLTKDFSHLWDESRGILVGLVAIPALAFIGHYTFMDTYGIAGVDHLVETVLAEWKLAPHFDFEIEPGLITGPARKDAAMTIVEFADFRCHHCRNAYPSLDNFVKTHPNVRMEFYNFALDGECNDNMPPNGLSCRLAEAVICANKQNAGWPMHHAVYNAQDEIAEMKNTGDIDQRVSQIAGGLSINTDELLKCMNDPLTKDSIHMQGKQGFQVKVQGTPTIFVNGRLLERGSLIPVLEGALSTSTSP